MILLAKHRYIYTILNNGKKYTFVTQRNIIQQKKWFDMVHNTVSRYENIEVYRIPQSPDESNYIRYVIA